MQKQTSIALVALAAGIVGYTVGEHMNTGRSGHLSSVAPVLTQPAGVGAETAETTEFQRSARPVHVRQPTMLATRTNRFMD